MTLNSIPFILPEFRNFGISPALDWQVNFRDSAASIMGTNTFDLLAPQHVTNRTNINCSFQLLSLWGVEFHSKFLPEHDLSIIGLSLPKAFNLT
jgi:hypothetical protein